MQHRAPFLPTNQTLSLQAHQFVEYTLQVQEGRLPVLLQELAKLELDLREAHVALKIKTVMHQRANNLRKDQVRLIKQM